MRSLSLERRLPLLIGGLVALAVLIALLLVRYELHRNAVELGRQRLEMLGAQLGDITGQSVQNRVETLRELAADPLLIDYATGRAADEEAVRDHLAAFLPGADAGLPVRLLSPDDRTLVAIDDTAVADPLPPELRRAQPLPAEPLDTVEYSRLHEQDDGFVYWNSVPVTTPDDRLVGRVVLQRRLSGGAGEQIEGLIGDNIELFFANREGGPWISMSAEPLREIPPIPQLNEMVAYRDTAGTRYFLHATAVPGTPWMVVLRVPAADVFGRSANVLGQLALIGLVLFVLGGFGAWLVSRSVTSPIRRLAAAADSIASGDYAGRTGLDRDDEIGRLAHSFDLMAERVQTTHVELERRYEQSRVLATELEQTNARLTAAIADAEDARLQAQEASRAKSEFLASMSHEIRTPINAVVGYTDLLDMGVHGGLTEQQRNYLASIRRSSEHLISVVNDVLDFAKIESGQLRIGAAEASASEDIAAVISMMEAPARAADTSLEADCAGPAPYVGDPHRVRQILLNLISNGIKFTEKNGHVRITCDRRRSRAPGAGADVEPSEWTCVIVEDDGIGIPADQHEHIFEAFVQMTGGYTRTHGGSGLGLAISRSLAHMMGGDLTVESTPGAGSTFTLWLPRVEHTTP